MEHEPLGVSLTGKEEFGSQGSIVRARGKMEEEVSHGLSEGARRMEDLGCLRRNLVSLLFCYQIWKDEG